MAFQNSMELHHHFPKLAEESGFAFNVHRPRIRTDWNKFRVIDIDNLIRERRFLIIEQHISDILNCVLESEFDVRILDEGVLKLFKLAQLTVEYQQFCRQYLDRSVYVMREELNSLLQELDATKKELKEKDEELKRFKKRSKHTYRPSLPYGNDNIATMILKTLSNKGDIFPSTSNDGLHYNKCSYCDKVFLNQLYLRSHMARRHTNVTELAQKDTEDYKTVPNDSEKSELHEELASLKTKLRDMEDLIKTLQTQQAQDKDNIIQKTPEEIKSDNKDVCRVLTKDAEVATNNEDYFIEKIEEWKKHEQQKYNSEISLLKTQIIETINTLKEKDTHTSQNNHKLIEELNITIKQQSEEILNLQGELNNSKIRSESEDNKRKQEMQTQLDIWSNRTATQSKQCEMLLQKLNEVATEARESRAIAESEKEKAEQLRALLQENLKNKKTEHVKLADKEIFSHVHAAKKTTKNKVKKVTVNKNFENLHRKAQELLSIKSSTSTDSSTESENVEKASKHKENRSIVVNKKTSFRNDNFRDPTVHDRNKINNKSPKSKSHDDITITDPKKHSNTKKVKSNNDMLILDTSKRKSSTSGSPVKIVRAKITEEVNSRLVSAGVDPLKSRIPRSVFQKQRMQLQQLHDVKSKKNASYQKIKNSILAYLDSSSFDMNKVGVDAHPYMFTNKKSKNFSLTNVLSNVKSKALSLVKLNETNIKSKQSINEDISKKAFSLLKSPPDSASSSPATQVKTNLDSSRRTSFDKLIQIKQKPHESEQRSYYQEMSTRKNVVVTSNNTDTDDHSSDSNHKYYNSTVLSKAKYTIDHLIKSPARRPSSATPSLNLDKLTNEKEDNMVELNIGKNAKLASSYKIDNNTSDDNMESMNSPLKKAASEDNLNIVPKQTKGVLKNASSTSSLNKKKVLFDMEAIQMKSVSASPSQSVTDKSDGNGKFELGLVNLDTEDWDISSIDNEPLKNDTRIQNNIRSPKIAELKKTIESQLARRNETPSTVLVGGVDVLAGIMRKTSSIAGSNTSLGSSILDESESVPAVNKRAFVKPKNVIKAKDDSDEDLSEYSVDDIIHKNKINELF